MASHRVVVAGLAAVFTVGMTSLASAGGWGWGGPGWGSGWGGPGGFGGWGGCGHCGAPSAAVVYAQPVAPLPPPPPLLPPPIVGAGCGCHSVVFAAPPIAPVPIAPAPIYVVNQGPEYSGPGITVPFHTWRPTPGYGPGPYWRGYGWGHRYGYAVHGWQYGAHVAYHRPYGFGYGYGYHHAAHYAYHRTFGGYPYRHAPMPPWGHDYPWNK